MWRDLQTRAAHGGSMQVGGGFVERKGGMVPGTQHRTVINCCQMSSNVTKFYQVHLIVPLYPFVSVSDYSDFNRVVAIEMNSIMLEPPDDLAEFLKRWRFTHVHTCFSKGIWILYHFHQWWSSSSCPIPVEFSGFLTPPSRHPRSFAALVVGTHFEVHIPMLVDCMRSPYDGKPAKYDGLEGSWHTDIQRRLM